MMNREERRRRRTLLLLLSEVFSLEINPICLQGVELSLCPWFMGSSHSTGSLVFLLAILAVLQFVLSWCCVCVGVCIWRCVYCSVNSAVLFYCGNTVCVCVCVWEECIK